MVFNSVHRLLRKLLGFNNLILAGHDLCLREEVLHLFVKPHKNGACCPKCFRRCRLRRRRGDGSAARESRTWRDIPAGGLSVCLHYRPREILCPTHGRLQEWIPWAAPNSRNTLRFEFQLLRLCSVMTQKEAAAQLGIPSSTMADTLHRVVSRYREGHKIRDLKNIGIDEISYKRGHRYLTVVYDLDRSCVVWIGKGKGRDTIDQFFTEVLSHEQRQSVLTACCDMSKAYMGAISHHLPKAVLVLDRFHIVKALNEAVDEVRKEQWRVADPAARKEFKNLRFILLKNQKQRTRSERALITDLERSHRRIFRACTLKDELSHFWEYRCLTRAENFLKRWCKRALLSRIEPIRRFVHTLQEHWEPAFASITGITNAVAEGINRLLRMAKNRASGFRSPQNFINVIYLIAGDLDLPAQIPPENRPRQTKPTPHQLLCL